MHRAQPSASRICEARNRDRAYQIHLEKLKKIKPSINAKAPKAMPHLKKNLKKIQNEQDRFEKIKYENQLLLNKMTDIMEKKYIDNENHNAKFVHSLNRDARKRELIRITRENQAILKRIQQKRPFYNRLDWERDRQQNEKYIQNICEYPYASSDAENLERTSLNPRYSNYHENRMTSYDEPEGYDEEEYVEENLPTNEDVEELIDQVDRQLEEAGIRDANEGDEYDNGTFETEGTVEPEATEDIELDNNGDEEDFDEEAANAADEGDEANELAENNEDEPENGDLAGLTDEDLDALNDEGLDSLNDEDLDALNDDDLGMDDSNPSNPTNTDGSDQVTVNVLSGTFEDDDLDTFVRVQLASGEATNSDPLPHIFTGTEPFQTQIQVGTALPKWNESFPLVCNFATDALVITVCNATTGEPIDHVVQKLSDIRYNDEMVITLRGGSIKYSLSQ